MSLSFTKLFSSITESTIWVEPNATRILWITMLAMADRKGRIFGSIPGLANRARITLAECEEAINRFMLPDPYSRTKEHDGRRIEEVDGGWKLINYEKYRALQDEETVREAKREWWRKHHGKEGNSNQLDETRKTRSHSIQAEAEAEANSNNHRSGDGSIPARAREAAGGGDKPPDPAKLLRILEECKRAGVVDASESNETVIQWARVASTTMVAKALADARAPSAKPLPEELRVAYVAPIVKRLVDVETAARRRAEASVEKSRQEAEELRKADASKVPPPPGLIEAQRKAATR